MEHTTFEEPIFCDFAAQLSPLSAKPLLQATVNGMSGHASMHPVMMGLPNGTTLQHSSSNSNGDMCSQRLPDCNTLLPGSPKMDSYKTPDYGQKLDFVSSVNKMGCYSPTQKYEYIAAAQQNQHLHQQQQQQHHGHLQQQQQHYSPPSPHMQNGGNGLVHHKYALNDYGHHAAMHSNGKLDYSPNSVAKLEYEHQLQQQQQHLYMGSPHHAGQHDANSMPNEHNVLYNNGNGNSLASTSSSNTDAQLGIGSNANGSNSASSNSTGGSNKNKNKSDEQLCNDGTNNSSNSNNNNGGSTASSTNTSSSASSASTNGTAAAPKKTDKKKGDPNGIKKKKDKNHLYGFPARRIGTRFRACPISGCFRSRGTRH